ncbi:hypothetical protein D3C76_658490 [compost metagenome]
MLEDLGEDVGKTHLLPDPAIHTVFQQAEPGSEDQLPIVQTAVTSQVAHAFHPAMPGAQTAIVQLDAQLHRLTNQLLGVEHRRLVDHVYRVARHPAQPLPGMGSQREQFLPLGRGQLQQASGLAQWLDKRSQCGVCN